MLTFAPILAQANKILPFIIKTDATENALGAILVQREKENEHPIEANDGRNYSTIEHEALDSPTTVTCPFIPQLYHYTEAISM